MYVFDNDHAKGGGKTMNQQENAALAERAARRALYSSLFSIVACAIMLFGTTFAWFTANRTSGVNTMTAANFDVEITEDNDALADTLSAGEHTITLTRTGGGTSPGYCRFTLTLSGSYNSTENVVYSDGTPGDSTEHIVELSETKNCYANFSGDADESVSFTLNLTNANASISDITASWGSNDGSNDTGAVVRRRARLLTAAPQPETVEITDGLSIDFGMEDQTVEVPASEEQEAEKAAAEEAAKAAEEAAKAAEETKTEETKTETTTMGDNNDGGTKSDKPDAGTGNTDSSGSGAGGSGSAGSGGGSGAGGGESESGAGGSGAGESESGSGESSGTDSGDSGSGTDSGSSGDSGS